MIYHGGEAEGTFEDLAETVEHTVRAIGGMVGHFDCIVVRGNSGVVVGAPVSVALGVPLVIVRKPDETSHNGFKTFVGMRDNFETAVFLDDFSGSGDTENAVIQALHESDGNGYTTSNPGYMQHVEVVATFMYRGLSCDGWKRPRIKPVDRYTPLDPMTHSVKAPLAPGTPVFASMSEAF